jgi:hypothetical protein
MVSAKEFVTAFVQHKGDAAEVATDFGMSVAAVNQRATKYRTMGVKLPKKRDGNKLDVAGLNNLIKTLK